MLTFFKGLGVGFLCLLLFVAGVVFNVEFLGKEANSNAMQLSTQIEAYTKLKPDTYEAEINFWANEKLSTTPNLSEAEKEQISQIFKEILARSAKDNFCTGGAYSLEANYSYENNLKVPKGQRLNATLQCEIKGENLNAFNAFLKDLNDIVAKSEFIGVSTPALMAVYSKETQRNATEKLNDELLNKAYEYEKAYSAKLNKKCVLTEFSFNQNGMARNFQGVMMSAKSLEKEAVSLPLTKEEELNARANLLFTCK
ncbi:SIMPL domain-containing protein [Campylobacter upsaliensis]|nr:SIMPL domain-containing protein [Campylobacter upsaliensis]